MSVLSDISSGAVGGLLGGVGQLVRDIREGFVGKEMTPELQVKLQQKVMDLELAVTNSQMEMIKAEASSSDPWTSRARPSFLYVVYLLILWALPMGFASIWYPQSVAMFTAGFKGWLSAIPSEMLQLFGVVMTGYVAGRSWEKVKGVAK